MSKILFFRPPSKRNVYLSTNVKVGAPSYPSLTLATLAGNLVNEHNIKVIDLDLFANFHESLFEEIRSFNPDMVASTVNTPDYLMVKEIMYRIKENFPQIKTIIGGVHVTALPDETSKEDCFDIIVLGEGDTAIPELLSSSSFKDVPGIIYKDGQSGRRINTSKRKLRQDLNTLPYPAWQLFELKKYRNSRLSSRINPAGLIETSRGCAHQCNFCNKLTFGSEYRTKDPKRVVDEMEYMLKCGFKEIHIIDDSFTQNIDRAKEICVEIINRNLKFPWSSLSGIRADMVDYEFFQLAKKSGCWQVGFGIESGDQDILNKINKKTTVAQIEKAVRLAKKAGIDTFGFFILALTGETEGSMKRTIEFSKKLPLDIAKFDICIPYPGTSYYKQLDLEGRIRTKNWSKYICHQIEEPLFDHPNLEWSTIGTYYKKAFKEFYLRPSYIMRRFMRSLMMGDLMYDIGYFLKSKW
ncbi:MAG: radical SAM protein [Candidatus Omnitrophota bacterium]